jgi:hypothetical protein
MNNRHGVMQLRALAHESDRATHGGEQTPAEQQRAKVAVGATYWKPWGDLEVTEWTVLGRRLGTIGRGVAWWIGDWVNYGNARFGQKYSRAARITGYDVQSLMNMAYVASRFDEYRRRQSLSWSHHAELAPLSIEYQEMWLENAERERISVRGLRDAVRAWRATQVGAVSGVGRQRSVAARVHGDPDPGPANSDVVCPQCGYHMDREE